MNIVISYDSSVTSANFSAGSAEEKAFKNAVTDAVNVLDSLFTTPVTVNPDVGWGEVDGALLDDGDIGKNTTTYVFDYSYSALKTALLATASASHDPAQLAAYATLPATNPLGGKGFVLFAPQALALGLSGPSSSATDGYVGFLDDAQFEAEYKTDWNFSVDPTSGQDFIALAEHEITEELGRTSLLGGSATTVNSCTVTSAYSLMDLFRYSSPGVRDVKPGGSGSTAYFSYNKGTTRLGLWNNYISTGDLGDWYPAGPAPGGNDAFNNNSDADVINALTTTDVTLMNLLGYDTAFPPSEIPNGVTGWIVDTSSKSLAVLSGGYLEVGSGGTALRTVISGGGSARIDAHGTASGTTVESGGLQVVAGGKAIDTTVSSGGTLELVRHGTVPGRIVLGGGTLIAGSGATLSHFVAASGVIVEVASGGSAKGTVISADATIAVKQGGTVDNATVDSGGTMADDGTVRGADIMSGADVTVLSGARLFVHFGDTADGILKPFVAAAATKIRYVTTSSSEHSPWCLPAVGS